MGEFERRIRRFSNDKELNAESLGGHVVKSFVLVDDNTLKYLFKSKRSENAGKVPADKTIADSRYFSQLFESLQSGNSNYRTYFNDLVDNSTGDGYIPRYVICLVKGYTDDKSVRNGSSGEWFMPLDVDNVYCEVTGSRLANAMGIKTVFNLPICSSGKELMAGVPLWDSVLSVDFVRTGEEFVSFAEQDRDLSLPDAIQYPYMYKQLKGVLVDACERYEIPLEKRSGCIKSVMSELMFQILFKWILCGDMDSAPRNFGLIVVNGESIECAPCFDMELLFDYDDYDIEYDTVRVFDFMEDIAPKLLRKFVTRAIKLRDTGKLEEIMSKSLSVPPIVYEKYLKKLSKRIEMIERRAFSADLLPQEYTDRHFN